METIKPYKKSMDYSYVLGAFPTYELIKARPEAVTGVFVHSSYTDTAELVKLCSLSNIPVSVQDKLISRLSDKENIFVIGVFKKYTEALEPAKPHLVFVNPGNMGNMGTIIRTALGFGVKNIALISPAVDVFHPKTTRASMGALFRIKHQYFDTFESYQEVYKNHEIFTFMLNGENTLTVNHCPKPELFTLVFGNEATGLDESYQKKGTSVMIPQTKEVDSLNLTIAVGVGVYLFSGLGQGWV